MPLRDAADAIDRRVGDAVSAAVQSHHRRRLSGLGNAALDAPAGGWAADAFQPRNGNTLELLIDGAQAFDRMIESLERATEYAHITGWFLSPAPPSAGTTSRPSWQARWSPTWPSSSPCAGGRSPASALPPPHPLPPPDPPPFSSSAPSRSTCTADCARDRSACSRHTCARS